MRIHLPRRVLPRFDVALVLACLLLQPAPATAIELTIHLAGNKPVARRTLFYTCDSGASRVGAPSGRFSVEYITGAGNGLVVAPLQGNSLVLSNVASASGARYVAQQYTWWEAGGSVTLTLESAAGKQQAVCRPTP